jgi:hypothetical protein
MQVEDQSFHTASTLKRTRFGFSAEVAADKPVASAGGTIEAVWKRAVTRHRTRQSPQNCGLAAAGSSGIPEHVTRSGKGQCPIPENKPRLLMKWTP